MADEDERIRKKAYELWMGEGQPEGRHDLHWEQAREIIALEDAGGPPTIPLDESLDEPVEPAIAFENQGEFPGLTDQGDAARGPELQTMADEADDRPLSTEAGARKTRTRRATAPTGEAPPPTRTRASKKAPARGRGRAEAAQAPFQRRGCRRRLTRPPRMVSFRTGGATPPVFMRRSLRCSCGPSANLRRGQYEEQTLKGR